MDFLVAFIIILGVIMMDVFLVKVYTILFELTGLTKEKARFQVISLITNCGFTTRESEIVTASKSRRKIGIACMLTGNVFDMIIVTLFINMVLTFNVDTLSESAKYIGIAFAVFVIIFILARIPAVGRALEKGIHSIYNRRHKDKNIVALVDMYEREAVARIYLNAIPTLLAEKSLANSKITAKYGINILSITRKNKKITVSKDVILQSGDVIIVFGDYSNIKDLFLNSEMISPEEIKSSENVIDLNDYYGGNAIGTVSLNHIPEGLVNKPLGELELTKNYHINVLYIKRHEELVSIDRSTTFEEDDEVTVYGPYDRMKEIFLK